jgi:hypothetical protein
MPESLTIRTRALGLLAVALVVSACSESPTSPSTPVAGAPAGDTRPATTAATPGASAPATSPSSSPATADTSPLRGFSLRFHANTSADVDQVKVPIDPHVAADVGRDVTIEFWIKSEAGSNTTATCQAGSDGWTYGNTILDRDVSGDGDFGEYGVSLSGGRIAFGVGRAGRSQTICGLIDVADGRWHHVALTRRALDGQMRVYVDGTESGQGVGPAGDISYRDGRPTAASQDPYLVVGAAKQDTTEFRPGFSGWLDDLRISSKMRYTVPFDRPDSPFTPDAETALLLHFDEGPAGPCASTVLDTSGRGVHGQCRHGGDATPGPAYATDVPFAPLPTRTQRTWLLGNEPGIKMPTAADRPGGIGDSPVAPPPQAPGVPPPQTPGAPPQGPVPPGF